MQKSSTKNSQANGSLRENVSVFWSHLLALMSRRNIGMRGHLRKGIILLTYQYFRFRIKTGAHFELNTSEIGEKYQGFWCWRIIIWFILPSIRMVTKLKPLLVHLKQKASRKKYQNLHSPVGPVHSNCWKKLVWNPKCFENHINSKDNSVWPNTWPLNSK